MIKSREARVSGRYATCQRCRAQGVPVFGRDLFAMSRVELCRGCIADLDLSWPVGAFDQPEPATATATAPDGLPWSSLVVVALFAALAVAIGLAVSSVARALAERLAN